MPKIAVGFTGCKINRYEVQVFSESLENMGMEIVPFNNKADCYIINTCSVTSKADASSRQLIRKSKKLSPGAKIVVTGCYAQLKPDELSDIGIDLLILNNDKETIPEKVAKLFKSKDEICKSKKANEFGSFIISSMAGLTRGFVKIQEGCDRQCTYCTIWKSRGPVRSRNPRFIIDEINSLHQNEYKEIVLTGVHIGSYNFNDNKLTGLLRLILKETDIPRIRLSSMYPTEINDDFIKTLSSSSRICPHIHISIQSGDNEILERMGRNYTRENLFSVINSLKDSIPGITIGADIIVGFPGEGEKQFANSYDLIEQSGVHHLHLFPFSARPGTVAAEMPGIISNDIKQERARILRELGNRLKLRHINSFINKNINVLFEKRPGNTNGFLTGLSEHYLRVNAAGDQNKKGLIVEVRPHSIRNNMLIADLTIN